MKTANRPDSSFSKNLHSKSRRQLLQSLPLLALAPSALAQGNSPVAVQKIHSFDIKVSDVDRSVDFYQAMFGSPIQSRQGETVCLRVGEGPHFFSISPAGPGESVGFSYIGLSVADFDPQTVQQQLVGCGIEPGPAPGAGEPRLALASRSWIIDRDGTRELYFADVEGLVYHLTSENYCGGSGPLGETCASPEPSSLPGMFELVGYSHFTNFMANRGRANEFYTRCFGKTFQAYQGPGAPVIGVGDGLQFLMYVGGEAQGVPQSPARIDHVCFSMLDFDVDDVLAQLTRYGLQARQDPEDTQPMMHWISMRMPNRGGAEGGTPELYFTDPDGIRIQLQDPGYCGGTGYLGDSCPPLD